MRPVFSLAAKEKKIPVERHGDFYVGQGKVAAGR